MGGEAKKRGTFEERKAEAVAKLAEKQKEHLAAREQLATIQREVHAMPDDDRQMVLAAAKAIWDVVKAAGPNGPVAVGLVGANLAMISTTPITEN